MTNTNTTTKMAPTSILKMMHPNHDYGDACAKCGKRDAVPSLFVEVTDDGVQSLGFFQIGTTCGAKLRKAGYNVVDESEVAGR